MMLNNAELALCSLRHGTNLDFSFARNVLKKYPLSVELVEVNLNDWDGKKQLPHRFHDQQPINSGRFPQIESYKSKNGFGYPSVTVLNSCISPKQGLYLWQMNQIRMLSLSGYKQKSRIRMDTSMHLHDLLRSWLEEFRIHGKMLKIEQQILEENPEITDAYIQSILPFVTELLKELKESDRDLIKHEHMVYNHRLIYKGKFDAILPINNKLTLIDWKGVSVGSKKSLETPKDAMIHMDNKMQLAAYVAAINSDPNFSNFPQVKQAAIVNVFQCGRTAEILLMDEEEIRYAFEQYKGWINAFWWIVANSKPMPGEIIDFCYAPPTDVTKKEKRS